MTWYICERKNPDGSSYSYYSNDEFHGFYKEHVVEKLTDDNVTKVKSPAGTVHAGDTWDTFCGHSRYRWGCANVEFWEPTTESLTCKTCLRMLGYIRHDLVITDLRGVKNGS